MKRTKFNENLQNQKKRENNLLAKKWEKKNENLCKIRFFSSTFLWHILASIQGFSAANPEREFAEESKSQKTQKSFMSYSPKNSQKTAKHHREIKGLRWVFSWESVQSNGREKTIRGIS